mmetsp:Transcript_24266/g.66753  ORF Transcript_24266/g.66753 Transcript_24266/m.66753 type:complete len:235 (+) Transcript_24266:281-985(+)
MRFVRCSIIQRRCSLRSDAEPLADLRPALRAELGVGALPPVPGVAQLMECLRKAFWAANVPTRDPEEELAAASDGVRGVMARALSLEHSSDRSVTSSPELKDLCPRRWTRRRSTSCSSWMLRSCSSLTCCRAASCSLARRCTTPSICRFTSSRIWACTLCQVAAVEAWLTPVWLRRCSTSRCARRTRSIGCASRDAPCAWPCCWSWQRLFAARGPLPAWGGTASSGGCGEPRPA